jgi:hypothetical protein
VITNARKIFTVGFATFALAAGLFASVTPSHAQTYYCHWTPRGTVCNQ